VGPRAGLDAEIKDLIIAPPENGTPVVQSSPAHKLIGILTKLLQFLWCYVTKILSVVSTFWFSFYKYDRYFL
jgi:hypothetical protein